jgi:hypothetical protein
MIAGMESNPTGIRNHFRATLPCRHFPQGLCSLMNAGKIVKAKLKISTANCGEFSILKGNKPFRFCPHTPRQAARNVLAGGFNRQP